MNQTVRYYRWEISVEISEQQLKQVVEEISIEKKIPEDEVERGIKQKIAVRVNQNEQYNKVARRQRRRYEGVSYII